MHVLLKIYLIGMLVLAGAIVINMLANLIGISTWYSFINSIGEIGLQAFSRQSVWSLLFLFIIYPALLGLFAFYAIKILK